jgi:Holliday junction resolvase RusA-like endonuclease
MGEIEIIKGNIPSKSNSYRIIKIGKHSSLGKTKELKSYEDSFYFQCRKYRNKNIQGEFKFECKVYYDSKRPDLDGSFKAVLDCLQKLNAFKNDNKCVEIHARKFKDVNNPRIEFKITEIKDWKY